MDESLEKNLQIAGPNAEYDKHAKRLLSHRIVLAHILVNVVSEFKGLQPESVIPLIEGEPEISTIPVNPGETNADKKVMPIVTGTNTESIISNEGSITYDIRFYVWIPNRKERVKILIDLEAQKKSNPGYDIVARGIFYGARMISAQLDTEFQIPHYNEIKKVYSIWICMNAPKYLENTALEYHIQPENIIGTTKHFGKYDLLSVIEVNLSKSVAKETDNLKLHRFLGTLFAPKLSAEHKIEILTTEYGISLSNDLKGRIGLMCNLSQAIEEEGIEQGIEQGMKQGMEENAKRIAIKMLQAGEPIEKIEEYTDLTKSELELLKQKR